MSDDGWSLPNVIDDLDAEAIVRVATRAGLRTSVIPVEHVAAALPTGGRMLTDDFAPVERLVAHLYRPQRRP